MPFFIKKEKNGLVKRTPRHITNGNCTPPYGG